MGTAFRRLQELGLGSVPAPLLPRSAGGGTDRPSRPDPHGGVPRHLPSGGGQRDLGVCSVTDLGLQRNQLLLRGASPRHSHRMVLAWRSPFRAFRGWGYSSGPRRHDGEYARQESDVGALPRIIQFRPLSSITFCFT